MKEGTHSVAIYNIRQANVFIQQGCSVIGVKKRQVDNKVAIIFKVDDLFNIVMTRWQNYEFKI